MTTRSGTRRKSKVRKKVALRMSLVRCGKCCHTARNHFKLRFHLARYHGKNTANSGKLSELSSDTKSRGNRQFSRHKRGVSSNSWKNDNPLTPHTSRNEVTEEDTEDSKIRWQRKAYRIKSETSDVPPTSSTRQLRTTRNAVGRCTLLARAKELKSRRESLHSVNETIESKRKCSKLRTENLKSNNNHFKSKSNNTTSKGENSTLCGKNTKSENENRKSKRSSKSRKKRNHTDLIPVPCHLCSYVGRDSYNLRRHMQSKHEPKPPKVPKIHQCEMCDYKNKYRFLVNRHSKVHFGEGGRRGKKSTGFPCDKCEYVSSSACNLKRHQFSKHEKVKEAKLQCSLCDHREPDRPALFSHFREAHGVVIETEKLEFDDFQSFVEFKMDTEKATFARFVRQQTRMGEKKHVIFKCHRDGVFKSKSRGERKRALKTTGSNKINSACPASMRMTIDPSGKVSVVFTKTHVGHSNEVCRLTLTKEEKMLIGEMLQAKRTFQEILSEIRNGMESERLERIHLLSRKDLQNIEKWYKNREVEEPPRLAIDINIEGWVAKVQDAGVVRLYKKPATVLPKPFKCLEYDDFVLILANDLQLAMLRQYGNDCICIDNAYENSQVKLTSLMVVDDNRQGFPCAFMLSSKIDRFIMKVFLDVIKKASKCPMTPSILVFDIPDYRRTEWSAVMDLPESAEVLYSPWSIDDDLNRNLLKIKEATERTLVCSNVRNLISEQNITEIPQLLEKTVKLLEENPGTELFGKYFKSKFADTAHRWALGFRNRLHVECTEGLENVHDILKFVYSEGQKNDKLEDCISVLMLCCRDQLQARIALYERIRPEKSACFPDDVQKVVDSIAKHHGAADEMKTQPADSGVYEIMGNNQQCQCRLRCFKCDVCIHSFRCSCDDSVLGWTVCRHIHFCVMNNPVQGKTTTLPITGSHFDPLEEKRKLLLEFENMCDNIAADEAAMGETTVVEVPVIEGFPREDGEQKQEEAMEQLEVLSQDGGEQKQVVVQLEGFPQGGGEVKEDYDHQACKLEHSPCPQEQQEQVLQPSPQEQLPQPSQSPTTPQKSWPLPKEDNEHQQQPPSPQQPQQLEDAKRKLQWRFQSICQQMSSDVDLTLIEQALASIENAIGSRQPPTQ